MACEPACEPAWPVGWSYLDVAGGEGGEAIMARGPAQDQLVRLPQIGRAHV